MTPARWYVPFAVAVLFSLDDLSTGMNDRAFADLTAVNNSFAIYRYPCAFATLPAR